MTQEIRQKLEQAAIQYGRAGKLVNECYPFMDGAQTILDNPAEWGLCSFEVLEATSVSVGKAWADNERLKSQPTKYREALEQLKELHSDHELTCILIEEALKQEVNND